MKSLELHGCYGRDTNMTDWAEGKDFNDWSPSDAITNEFLCELNASR